MTPDERRHLQELDDMVLDASPEELRRIQQMDYRTQLDCMPFYGVCIDSASLVCGGDRDGEDRSGVPDCQMRSCLQS